MLKVWKFEFLFSKIIFCESSDLFWLFVVNEFNQFIIFSSVI